jgi:hypothetical protein
MEFHLQVHAEDPAWCAEFLQAVGPEATGRAVASIDPSRWSPSSFETARSAFVDQLVRAGGDAVAS